MKTCDGCYCETQSCLTCNACKASFCCKCLNYDGDINSEKDVHALKCPSCSNVTRRTVNDSTPVRSKTSNVATMAIATTAPAAAPQLPNSSMAFDFSLAMTKMQSELSKSLGVNIKKSFGEFRKELEIKLCTIDENLNNLKSDLQSYRAEIKCEINALREDQAAMQITMCNLTQDVMNVKESLDLQSGRISEFEKFTTTIPAVSKKLEYSDSNIQSLITKMDAIEQQARQFNIEISNVLERKNENLIAIVETIGKKIGITIAKSDILSIHRVPHAASDNKKPKNIIMKMSSRILRDNILSAFRLKKGLTSDQLGLSGSPVKVYLNEHLTLKNKKLFRDAKEAAKISNFQYVWIRNATILVRESNTAPIIAVRSHSDINKIKAQSKET